MYERHLSKRLVSSLKLFRVTVLNGSRQSGKTTLARMIVGDNGTYRTFDDELTRQQASFDPTGFVDDGARPLVIDEIQRVGESIVLAVKQRVDSSSAKGQFVLAGSTRFLSVPTISESLAGRAEILDLWPLSQGEIIGTVDRFVDLAIDRPTELGSLDAEPLSRFELFQRVSVGGFPEVVSGDHSLAARWHRNYLRTVIERDVVNASAIRQADELPRLLRLLAANSSAELVPARLAGDLKLGDDMTRRYLGLLELVGLLVRVPAWTPSVTTREKRHAKAYLVDTGLACALLGVNTEQLASPGSSMAGPLLESFVTTELMKQSTWSDQAVTVRHWRDRDAGEIDVLLEADDGRIAGVEVKGAASVTAADFRHLARLRDTIGGRFTAGIVLYLGNRPTSFGDRLIALPVQSLWAASD